MYMRILNLLAAIILATIAHSQDYFPPLSSEAPWDTLNYETLGWCEENIESFYQYLEEENSKAFILLKDGRIVLEKYFDNHDRRKPWYWASAGKTLMAFMVGLAQEEGHLSIDDKTNEYLGSGWTNCNPDDENKIKIIDQLQMTTGLDDGVADPFCTDPECLSCLSAPGSRWAYHNAPYTLLASVIENATDRPLNEYVAEKLHQSIGMDGRYVSSGFNKVYYSTARSMARFGLLMLNNGIWAEKVILRDSMYLYTATQSTQEINPAYGYLWWLNGKESYMVPGSQFSFNGSLSPASPMDLFAGLGKNGQILAVIPSENMVWIRMGDSPSSELVPFKMLDAVSEKINQLPCISDQSEKENEEIRIYAKSSSLVIDIKYPFRSGKLTVMNQLGQTIAAHHLAENNVEIPVSRFAEKWIYVLIDIDGKRKIERIFKP